MGSCGRRAAEGGVRLWGAGPRARWAAAGGMRDVRGCARGSGGVECGAAGMRDAGLPMVLHLSIPEIDGGVAKKCRIQAPYAPGGAS